MNTASSPSLSTLAVILFANFFIMSKVGRANKWTDKSQVWTEELIKSSWEKIDFHTFPINSKIQWTENLLSTYERQISWERLAQNIYLGNDIKLLIAYRNHFLKNQVAQSYLSKNSSIVWDKQLCEAFGININWLINSKNKSIDTEFFQEELKQSIKQANENLTLYYINEKYVLCNSAGHIIHYGLTQGDYISPGSSLLSNEIIRLIDNSKIRREYFFKTYRPGNDDWEFDYSGIFIIDANNSLIEIEKNYR